MGKIIKNFDYLAFAFDGNSLIEASAGTGKTHTIVILYLRLLLGINTKHFGALPVNKILVVTFTKVAVRELRERIRNNIQKLRMACLLQDTSNTLFSELLKKISNTHLAYERLSKAEYKIDRASIFTIHSFCQHILNVYPIELNSIFRYNIIEDEICYYQKACNDFWRYHFYSLPKIIIFIIEGYWRSPKELLEEIYPYLDNLEINIQLPSKRGIISQHKHIVNYIKYVKRIWNIKKDELLKFINSAPLNRRVYNLRNILNWFHKINLWSNEQVIQNYNIPKELDRFRYSVLMGYNILLEKKCIVFHPFFKLVDILFHKVDSLKRLILGMAIHEIRNIVKNIKKQSSEISFNDLIYLLDDALSDPNQGKNLAQLIRNSYPIAIIDEFQDTDFRQYRIFHTLYSSFESKYGLLLIGDPKQSIYSFRGADIFSYLLARKNIDYHYTLKTNWRSSIGMVNGINKLFQFNSSHPFVFYDIPFIPLKSKKKNKELFCLIERGIPHPAISFWLPTCNQLSVYEYQKIMANQCARTIQNLLHGANYGHVWLQDGNNKKLLQMSDIVILVRNRNEGSLISSILEKLNIANVYISNKKNIFETSEATDILVILEAVLAPENNNKLRCALITNIIGYDLKKIEYINQNIDAWNYELAEFTHYYFFWRKYGVQPMLREIISRRGISKHLLASQSGERCLINILHLSEILQKKSLELNNACLLVDWLNTKINFQNITCSDDQMLRTNVNNQLIQIMTIHKAKGLEFPLVFLPFISTSIKKKYPLFHDRESYQIYLDLSSSKKNVNLFEEEKLSEDVRLLYVAITRSIYHCFIGIGAISFKRHNKNCNSDLHRTALGHLIQNGIPGNIEFLKKCLKKLVHCSDGNIIFNVISTDQKKLCESLMSNNTRVNRCVINKEKYCSIPDWNMSSVIPHKVTSYSNLSRLSSSSPLISNLEIEESIFYKTEKNKKCVHKLLTPHTFPRGSVTGKFFHRIFQKWNFKDKICDDWLSGQLNRSGIDLIWVPVLQEWIKIVASVPLNDDNFMLSKLSSTNYISELQFYLSINNLVSAEAFNKICVEHDPISKLSSSLKFSDIIGFLHGFIDLVFFWKNKYYLLDYKSNWLGNSYSDYVLSNIKREIVLRHYALQYQIYTLALHRFLRDRLIGYDYEKDIGGVYYLFLRGVDLSHPNCGIYFCRPKRLLIDQLDILFSF